MTLLPLMRPMTEATDRFRASWEEFLDHGAGCSSCRGENSVPCPEGVRLEEIHTAARKQLYVGARR